MAESIRILKYHRALARFSVVLLALCTATAINAAVLWRAPHDARGALRASIETPDKANLAIDTLILPSHVITDTGVVVNRRLSETRFGSAGNWIWAQNVSPGNVDAVYKRTQRSSWQLVAGCPDLFDGSKFIVGAIHCENGSLLRYRGAQVIARLDPPPGYRIRDIVSETLVLLQRDSDARYATGTVQSTRIAIAALQSVGLNNLTRRLTPPTYSIFDQSNISMYQTPSGYTFVALNNAALANLSFATTATPLLNQQCLTQPLISLGTRRFFSIERGVQQKWLRIYRLDSAFTLEREEQLDESDEMLCSNSAYLIKHRPSGDEIQFIGIGAPQAGTVVTHPQDGPARVYIVGQIAVAQFANQSIRLLTGTNTFSAPLSSARASPYWITSEFAFGSPLREVYTQADLDTDAVRIVDRSRDHATGIISATQVWDTEYFQTLDVIAPSPQALKTPGARVYIISVLETLPTGSLRSARLLVPSSPSNTLRALRDQAGAAARLARTVVAGQSIFGQSVPDDAGSAQLYRWDFAGQLLSQATIVGAEMLGQANGQVLLSDLFGTTRQIRMHDGANQIWQRPLLTGCAILALDNFPALDCLQTVNSTALSSISKLDLNTGANVWVRTVTPVDISESWRVRQAWLREGQLFLLSWTTGSFFGTAQQPGLFSSARLDASTGALLSVGPSLSTPVNSLAFEARERYLFGDDWLRFSAANPLLEPNIRQRFAIRVGPTGQLSSMMLGLSVASGEGFSENYLYTSTNEGPRWYATDGFNFEFQTVARTFPEPVLTLPLTLEITERTNVIVDNENVNTVVIVVRNPNNAIAQGARLHTGRMDCSQVDTEQNSLLFDVPANSNLTLTCTAWAEPTESVRTALVQMRQPMNFSLLQSPALSQASVLLSAPFQNGFED